MTTQPIKLCSLDELDDGAARRFDVDDRRLSVIRIRDDVFVVGDRCSHADFSLSNGVVDTGDKTIECPKHGALFSVRTGQPETLPATKAVPTYQVAVDDGDVLVTLT